jgi:hypothetical protein
VSVLGGFTLVIVAFALESGALYSPSNRLLWLLLLPAGLSHPLYHRSYYDTYPQEGPPCRPSAGPLECVTNMPAFINCITLPSASV